ncbi:diadenosine tetraphosphatase [Paenibacillus konkukensis]|uniref:Diadenosine tetraphosphatase n=1 Tax=Paenibacillus konkukensis TaxID=2020716 RepID=A0ABY4RVE6_9BACL|nr:metallophosphoesterase [Paenibacillus konkukensis]UQZ85661.1 diadenosine tetraphosphatase [Paenibacillus konkukensis]
MEMRTRVHTIFMLIGSTECGKTTFANEVLMPGLKRAAGETPGRRLNVQYLSSDDIRQELLGYDYDKYDQVMLEASEQAFRLLFEKLKLVTSFPVSAEFVVIDTTGLSEDFRAQVRAVARDRQYRLEAVVFDYRQRSDYYASERSKKLISQHITRLKREVLGALAREGYDQVHKIRCKDFYSPEEKTPNAAYTVVIDNWDDYAATMLPPDQKYIVVGDVHECLSDLKGLLQSCGYKLEDGRLAATDKTAGTKIILAGDWIDKGGHTRETVEFLYDNREHFLFVKGNHEHFVDKYTRGDIQGADPELLNSYFGSTRVLLQDEELLGKFRSLIALSRPFYWRSGGQGPSFYVTHAPCRSKYIGKLDADSLRHQRNLRIDREAPLEEQLAFLKEEAVVNHPYHLFGHIAAKRPARILNKLHIDTGAVHGNMLTAVSMAHRPFYKSHPSGQTVLDEPLQEIFPAARSVSLQDLEEEDLRRLRYCSRNKVNFISGTMSPADKDEAAQELESLKRGLSYFAGRGVREVVLQPKYMGSRCNIYLHRDAEQCFAVSRNGYKIARLDLSAVYGKLLDKFGAYMERNRIAMLLLDGELMPWKSLGDGLIQKQFMPIGKALESEFAFLQQNGFEAAWEELLAQYDASGFEQDQFHLSKKALNDKYGNAAYHNYKYVREAAAAHVPLQEHIDAYQVYKKQLELYAGDGELDYKPFALLKTVCENGEERIPEGSTSEMYRFVSDDDYLLLDLADPGCYAQAEAYFARLTVANQMEGVVIKPERADGTTVPYMKVRNAEYLSIIYGYDYRFAHKYKKLIKQKNIAPKLRTSLNEYRLGQAMLAIPFDAIDADNEDYRNAAANLLFETAQEKVIDPRL